MKKGGRRGRMDGWEEWKARKSGDKEEWEAGKSGVQGRVKSEEEWEAGKSRK